MVEERESGPILKGMGDAITWTVTAREEGGVFLLGECGPCCRLALHGWRSDGKDVEVLITPNGEQRGHPIEQPNFDKKSGKFKSWAQTIKDSRSKYDGKHFSKADPPSASGAKLTADGRRHAAHCEYVANRGTYDGDPPPAPAPLALAGPSSCAPQPVLSLAEQKVATAQEVARCFATATVWVARALNLVAAAALAVLASATVDGVHCEGSMKEREVAAMKLTETAHTAQLASFKGRL